MADLICATPITRGPNKGLLATGTHTGYRRHLRANDPACEACLAFNTAAQRRWREVNPDKVREANRRYAEYQRQWAKANPDKAAAKSRRYRIANADRVAEWKRQWKQTNPDRWNDIKRLADARRRARKAAASIVDFTAEQLAAKMAYWGDRCWIRIHCDGVPFESVDHVIPLAKGGLHVLANLRPACIACNGAKADRRIV